jgi:ABC-type transport system substrate-binding protein
LLDPGPGAYRQTHDLARALEEMRLAGLAYDPASGLGGYAQEIPYLAVVDTFSQQSAEIFQQQLARIGIRIRIELVSFPTYLARAARRKNALMGYTGWQADFPEPSTFLEPNFASSSIQEEESMNFSFFSDRTFDELLRRARRTTDAAERAALYRKAEDRVLEEAAWAVTYSYRFFELWQPYVHGYRPHPVLSYYVRNAYLDREQQRRVAHGGSFCRSPFAALKRGCRGAPATALGLAYGGSR